MITNITKENFENEVLKADKPVLVDFFATWCGPCKMLSPIVDEIADEHPEVKVCKLDIDANTELAIQYGVMSVPTLVVFEGGKVKETAVGLRPKEDVLALIK